MEVQISQKQLEDLYHWIDTIPLSRKKKNLPRDFSDAVLMAEVIAHFFPNLVDLFNYDQGLKVETKVYNWKTLNTRVLKKLSYNLSPEVINNLANAKPGVIEKVLFDVRNVINNKIEQDQNPYADLISDNSIEEEIESAKHETNRKVLEAKIKEVDEQNQYIKELEEKISNIEKLIQTKDEKIFQLSDRAKR